MTASRHSAAAVLSVRNLKTVFDSDHGQIVAVDGISFEIGAGEIVGLVGESGSGKSATASSIIGLVDAPGRIVEGTVRFKDAQLVGMTEFELEKLRGREIGMVFQDPMTSLNPVLRIGDQLTEVMTAHGFATRSAALARAIELLGVMGVNSPERAVNGYPHQFSGGTRQRIVLAMGVGNKPSLLIADEPTTALDVTIQAQILELLREINREFGASILLITHDLGVVAGICTRTLVMYAGEIVEDGPTEALLADPKHPYTWALVNAAPRLDRDRAAGKRLPTIEGVPPDPTHWPDGCRFAPRCPFRSERCTRHPDLLPLDLLRSSRCLVAQADSALGTPTVAAAPKSSYRFGAAASAKAAAGSPLLTITDLCKHYPLKRASLWGPKRLVRAVDGLNFTVDAGETVGLVGESGSGKSSLGRMIVRVQEPTSGQVCFDGIDISHANRRALRPLRRRLQMIFQDPYASLNPRMRVADIIGEPLRIHRITAAGRATRARVDELLDLVGLSTQAAKRFPHEFSGGQRQRISIARALAAAPDFIVADEPVSALDVNIRAQILNLMVDLQEQYNLTYLLITHDLAVVRQVADRIMVMYLGKLVEAAPAGALFSEPIHPYTRFLIESAPIPDVAAARSRRRLRLKGEAPSAISPPSGCRFRTRCPIAEARCAQEEPEFAEHAPGHWAACHFPGRMT